MTVDDVMLEIIDILISKFLRIQGLYLAMHYVPVLLNVFPFMYLLSKRNDILVGDIRIRIVFRAGGSIGCKDVILGKVVVLLQRLIVIRGIYERSRNFLIHRHQGFGYLPVYLGSRYSVVNIKTFFNRIEYQLINFFTATAVRFFYNFFYLIGRILFKSSITFSYIHFLIFF